MDEFNQQLEVAAGKGCAGQALGSQAAKLYRRSQDHPGRKQRGGLAGQGQPRTRLEAGDTCLACPTRWRSGHDQKTHWPSPWQALQHLYFAKAYAAQAARAEPKEREVTRSAIGVQPKQRGRPNCLNCALMVDANQQMELGRKSDAKIQDDKGYKIGILRTPQLARLEGRMAQPHCAAYWPHVVMGVAATAQPQLAQVAVSQVPATLRPLHSQQCIGRLVHR